MLVDFFAAKVVPFRVSVKTNDDEDVKSSPSENDGGTLGFYLKYTQSC